MEGHEEAKMVVVVWHADDEESTVSRVVRHNDDTLKNAVMSHLGKLLGSDVETERRDVYIDHVISIPQGEEIKFDGMMDDSYLPKEWTETARGIA